MKIQTKAQQTAAIETAKKAFEKTRKAVTANRRLEGYQGFSKCAYAAFTAAAYSVSGFVSFTATGATRVPKTKGNGDLLYLLLGKSAVSDMKGRRNWIEADKGTVSKVNKKARDDMAARIVAFANGSRNYTCEVAHIKAFEKAIKSGGKVEIKIDGKPEVYNLNSEVKAYA